MKRIKKIIIMMLVLLVSIAFTQADETSAKKLKLNKSSITLIKGDSKYLTLNNNYYLGKKWKSSNKRVATVSKYGYVLAKGKGTCTVSCKYKKKTYKCKVRVDEPYLSETSINITFGETRTLMLLGTNLDEKWESDDISVAKVDNIGFVEPVGVGSTSIYATVSGHIYRCKVTVRYDSEAAVKKLKIENYKTRSGIVALVTNNSGDTISLEGKAVFYSENGSMLDNSTDYDYCLEPRATCVLKYNGPEDSYCRYVSYDKYDIVYNVGLSQYKSYSKDISIEADKGADNITAKIQNKANESIDTINVVCVFFDENGNVIDSEEHYSDAKAPGAIDFKSYEYPYDSNYDTIIPSSYKIYVNHAYQY